MPVREALILLEYQGLVDRLPNNHVRVSQLSEGYFQKIFEMFLQMEQDAFLYVINAHVFNHLPIPQQYFCDQMQSFADIVNGTGDGLAANIKDGQANQHLLDAIVESAEKGTWLSL